MVIKWHILPISTFFSLTPRELDELQRCEKVHSIAILTRVGTVLGTELAQPREVHPPPLTRLLEHVATRSKRHSKERLKIMTKLLRSLLGQVKGQVTKGQILPLSTFFYKSAHNSGSRRFTAPRKKTHLIALLTLFRYNVLRFDLRLRVWPLEPKNSKNTVSVRKKFYCNNF